MNTTRLTIMVTYPVTPARFQAIFGEHGLDDDALLLLSAFTCADESGAQVEFFDAQNDRVGNLQEIIHSIQNATWPDRFRAATPVVLSESVLKFLRETQFDLNLKSQADVVSVAVHLMWMARHATRVRTTLANGKIDNICIPTIREGIRRN